MEMHQIRYFVTVAETGSFKHAASQLFVTRQAVGRGISQLEEEMGYPLFERTPSGLNLTRAAKCFLPRAQELIEVADRLQRDMKNCAEGTIPQINLSFSYTTYAMYERAISTFSNVNAPAFSIEVSNLSEQKCLEFLRENKVDIAITTIPTWEEHCRLLAEYPICLMMSKENPLASMDNVSLCDLKGETFLAYNSGTESPLYVPDSIIYSLNPNQLILSNDLIYLFRRVRENRGILMSVVENMGNLLEDAVFKPFPAGGTWKHYLSLSSAAATKPAHIELYESLFRALSPV